MNPKKTDVRNKDRFLLIKNWLNEAFLFDVVFILGAIIFAGLLWWPLRFLPYYGESVDLVINGARFLNERGFDPFVLKEMEIAHQTLVPGMVAVVWKLFGDSREITRAVFIPFLSLLMISTYLLGKKLLSKAGAVVAAFTIGLMPVTVASLGLMFIDLLVVAIVMSAVALWQYKRSFWAMLFLTLAVLMKGTAIFFLPMFVWWYWKRTKMAQGEYRVLLIPLLGWLGWHLYHAVTTGWWFLAPARELVFPDNPVVLFKYVVFVLFNIVLNQGVWILLIPGLLSLLWLTRKKSTDLAFVEGVGLSILVFVGFWSIKGGYNDFQAVMVLPLLIVGSLYLIEKGVDRLWGLQYGWIVLAVSGVMTLLNLTLWYPERGLVDGYEFRKPANLSYQDMILVGREAAGYIEASFPDAKIYGGFPEAYQLTQPHQGYVSKRLDFSLCSTYVEETNKQTIVYIHPFDATQIACNQLREVHEVTPIKRFESNGVWIQLVGVNTASGSAEIE
mgnify:CR=1 FL=1